MRRLRSVLIPIGLCLCALLALAAGALWATLPPSAQSLAIPGLSAPVSVAFDAAGVPHVHAADATDAAAALGFVHARDRMMQMELTRRAGSGRLAEIAGPAALDADKLARTLGLRRAAEAEWAAMDPDAAAMLRAYARGVNAWIAARGRFAAPEFLLLGAPEPWSPVDSLLWGKAMALYLAGNYRIELARAALAPALPPAMLDALWPGDVASSRPDAALAKPAAALLARLPRFPMPFTQPETASDEWAVDGRHSATGAPILAGDPHLGLGLPGVWYLARIDLDAAGPGGTLAGATAPGSPFLVLGRNRRIAWSLTNTGADTQDLFVETLLPGGRYLTPSGPAAFATHRERIRVRGQSDVVLTIRESRHGPILSDVLGAEAAGAAPPGTVLALSDLALKPGNTAAAGLLALNRAGDVAAAGRAAALLTAPVNNLMVADRAGIALFTTGAVPVRRAGDGGMPQPGADGLHDWIGVAAGEQLPHVVAPADGMLANGNDRVAPPGYPVLLTRDWYGPWRARRIRELLGEMRLGSVPGFAAMQVDVTSDYARELLPRLRRAAGTDPFPGWNGEMRRDRFEPLLFNAWIEAFGRVALARGHAESWPGPHDEFVAGLLRNQGPAQSAWCGGDCDAALRDALHAATARLARDYGADRAGWRWGRAHRAVFANPLLSRLPLLGWLTTRHLAAPGDNETLFRAGWRGEGFDAVHGASYRGVYDLAEPDRSLFVNAPGQSGNPISRFAASLLGNWREGRGFPLPEQAAGVSARVALRPAPDAPANDPTMP